MSEASKEREAIWAELRPLIRRIGVLEEKADHPLHVVDTNGKTLRDQFAMAALGECADYYFSCPDQPSADSCAEKAYEFADAMLKAREARE